MNPAAEPKSYKDLTVWQQGRKLVQYVYLMTKTFPAEERYDLVSQMRRAAVSIPSNIAEGCGRQHPKDTIQFLIIARGSLYELETQIYLCFDLSYITEADLEAAVEKIEKMIQLLQGFICYYRTLAK
ncbi:four helix bundle protein [Hymenobacter edaphi]|uniref:Four helix bundle protein n=1 Tax=Hymenobacter edaphi TaxID=2211146 RepID=A0A328BUL4_9BACT|nr:four helix bundle protein [Hymenobacter edaphi]RAK70221.1 four helix bundle protein [Hymenobacter edaphi]